MYYFAKCLELSSLFVIGGGMIQNFPKLMNPNPQIILIFIVHDPLLGKKRRTRMENEL